MGAEAISSVFGGSAFLNLFAFGSEDLVAAVLEEASAQKIFPTAREADVFLGQMDRKAESRLNPHDFCTQLFALKELLRAGHVDEVGTSLIRLARIFRDETSKEYRFDVRVAAAVAAMQLSSRVFSGQEQAAGAVVSSLVPVIPNPPLTFEDLMAKAIPLMDEETTARLEELSMDMMPRGPTASQGELEYDILRNVLMRIRRYKEFFRKVMSTVEDRDIQEMVVTAANEIFRERKEVPTDVVILYGSLIRRSGNKELADRLLEAFLLRQVALKFTR